MKPENEKAVQAVIEELKEKLDNTKSYVEDVQAALEDGSFSDAYDAASDAESEAEYEDY